MDDLKKLQPIHLDVLKEIGNIGAGNAATSLSVLLNMTIDMSVPDVRVVPLQEIHEQIGGADTEVAAIFLRIEGQVTGSMYFITNIDDIEKMIRRLTKNDQFQLKDPPYDEMGISAFLEVGNILAGSYLSSFSDFTKIDLQPSVPGVSIDMAGAILSYGLIPLSEVGDLAIVIDTEIVEVDKERQKVSGHFFLLPDPGSFQTIFNALGVHLNE
ncbi:chemotaxis protein CheC [Bacillus sp. JCM 19034]|uniref:chemotaxis protein CheC n=1 Tax=Bacillus sp. JCM 19034 TaxID=1481928 RepID=UPI0007862E33|nr:chemotaxis protein CheC [Bacillus sp. JCM 19034]